MVYGSTQAQTLPFYGGAVMSALPRKGPVNFANAGDDRLHLIGLDLALRRVVKRPALAAFTGFSTAVPDGFDAGNKVLTF